MAPNPSFEPNTAMQTNPTAAPSTSIQPSVVPGQTVVPPNPLESQTQPQP